MSTSSPSLSGPTGLPGLDRAWLGYGQALWSQPYLPALVLERCRQRLLQLHGAPQRGSFLGPGPDPVPRTFAETPGEALQACLDFAELYAQDPEQLTDAQAEAVKSHFGEEGLVVLIQALGLFDAQCRLELWSRSQPATPREGQP